MFLQMLCDSEFDAELQMILG